MSHISKNNRGIRRSSKRFDSSAGLRPKIGYSIAQFIRNEFAHEFVEFEYLAVIKFKAHVWPDKQQPQLRKRWCYLRERTQSDVTTLYLIKATNEQQCVAIALADVPAAGGSRLKILDWL